MSVSIRPATPEDLPLLLPMVHALSLHHDPEAAPPHTEGLAEMLWGPKAHGTALLAFAAGAAVGYAIYGPFARFAQGSWGGELHHIYLCEAARGTGAGRALISAAEQAARADGLDRLVLSAGTLEVEAFYLAVGYTQLVSPNPRFRKMLSAD